MVCRLERVFVVLNQDDGVAKVAQALQGLDEPRIVARVQADGRLVEDIQHARQPGADLPRELYAL